MDSEGPNYDERSFIFEEIYRIVGQIERRFDALRDTDREAVKLAHNDLSKRLEGFPQQYATKVEMETAAAALQRLEKGSLPREIYDQQYQVLEDLIMKLDRDKLNLSVFDTFVDNYRIGQDAAIKDRQSVVEVLTNATDQVRSQVLAERSEFLSQEAYDMRHQVLVQQVDAIERWQYKLVGGLVFATFVAPLVTGTIVYVFTKRI